MCRRLVVLIAVASMLLLACQAPDSSSRLEPLGTNGGRPECPHTLSIVDSANQRTITEVALAGEITNIPEFHDCQKFIMPGRRYGPLVGIWVSVTLRSVQWPGATSGATPVSPGVIAGDSVGIYLVPTVVESGVGVPVAEVYNWDRQQRYDPLGIDPGWNCLYFISSTEARMVPVSDERECVNRLPPGDSSGTPLEIRSHQQQGPPAGRWAWDPTHSYQYIMMGCPAGWCEIGPRGFGSEPQLDPAGLASASLSVQSFVIGPFYDRQTLAVQAGGDLVPGALIGAAYPAPDLGDWTAADFSGPNWRLVAWAVVDLDHDKYKNRMNLRRGGVPAEMTVVEMCKGSALSCLVPNKAANQLQCQPEVFHDGSRGDPWWARITSHKKTLTGKLLIQYHCVTRREHTTNIPVPGTVRWRWILSDETVWTRCGQGCCQVE